MLHVPEQYSLHRSSLQSAQRPTIVHSTPVLGKEKKNKNKEKKNLIYIFIKRPFMKGKKAMTPQQKSKQILRSQGGSSYRAADYHKLNISSPKEKTLYPETLERHNSASMKSGLDG